MTHPRHEPRITTHDNGTHVIRVVLTTFGTLHCEPPINTALTVNLADQLRNPPEDPRVRAAMLQNNGLTPYVRDYVLATPGAQEIVDNSVAQLRALVAGWGNTARPSRMTVRGTFFCKGGRHRSVAIAEAVADALNAEGIGTEVDHMDILEPVV